MSGTATKSLADHFVEHAERQPEAPELSDAAASVLGAVADGPASADELRRGVGVDASTLAAALAELELAGVVAEADGLYRAVMRPD